MSDIAPAAGAAAIRSAQDGGPGGGDAAPTVSEPTNQLTADFETFLRLLTTQLRNQDPLAPIESTEFVAQLAAFSSVEQQVETNKQLGSILEQLAGGDPARLADWLGKDVLSTAATPVDGSGAGVEVSLDPPEEVEPASAALVVLNADGETVAEIPFEPSAERILWNGRTAEGAAAPAGLYGFSARYADANGATELTPARSYGRVVEARRGEDGVSLVLEGGATTEASAVTGVRSGD